MSLVLLLEYSFSPCENKGEYLFSICIQNATGFLLSCSSFWQAVTTECARDVSDTSSLFTKCISTVRDHKTSQDTEQPPPTDDPSCDRPHDLAYTNQVQDEVQDYQVDYAKCILSDNQSIDSMSTYKKVDVIDINEEYSYLEARSRLINLDKHSLGNGSHTSNSNPTLALHADKAAVLQRYLTELTDSDGDQIITGQGKAYSTQEQLDSHNIEHQLELAGITLSTFKCRNPRAPPPGNRHGNSPKRLPHVFGKQDPASANERKLIQFSQLPKDFVFTEQGPVYKPTSDKAGFSVLRGFTKGPSIANGVHSLSISIVIVWLVS